jgi:hypothetical protein
MSKLQEKPSALKREHPALEKPKFFTFFLCLWVIFALLDPDTDPRNPLNPDRQHCFLHSHSTAIVCTGRAAVLHYCADWVRVGLHQAHSHQPGEEDIHDCPSPTGLYLYHFTQKLPTFCLGSNVSLQTQVLMTKNRKVKGGWK